MKHITVVIPTRNRLEKLLRTVYSIMQSFKIGGLVDLFIVFDGDEENYKAFGKYYEKLHAQISISYCIYVENNSFKHVGSVACRNYAMPFVKDGLLYATDDIIFYDNAIEKAFNDFNYCFPDDDGVVGFSQDKHSFNPAGVALVGRKFIERYPERKVFCPLYYHFAAQEVHILADKLNRFYLSSALLLHKHPAFYKDENDKTHDDARKFKYRDTILMKQRKADGVIWGMPE